MLKREAFIKLSLFVSDNMVKTATFVLKTRTTKTMLDNLKDFQKTGQIG